MTSTPPNNVSLDRLVRDFYPYVRRLALSILDDGNPGAAAEADDATQEIFLLAARSLPQFRGEASLKTWLTKIATNYCRGRLRKRRSFLRLLRWIGDQQRTDHHQQSPEDSVRTVHVNQALWSAVDRLPEKQRVPIILFYVHELTTAEIASSLDLPEGTVHSRLHHARRKLQDLFEEYDG